VLKQSFGGGYEPTRLPKDLWECGTKSLRRLIMSEPVEPQLLNELPRRSRAVKSKTGSLQYLNILFGHPAGTGTLIPSTDPKVKRSIYNSIYQTIRRRNLQDKIEVYVADEGVVLKNLVDLGPLS